MDIRNPLLHVVSIFSHTPSQLRSIANVQKLDISFLSSDLNNVECKKMCFLFLFRCISEIWYTFNIDNDIEPSSPRVKFNVTPKTMCGYRGRSVPDPLQNSNLSNSYDSFPENKPTNNPLGKYNSPQYPPPHPPTLPAPLKKNTGSTTAKKANE